MLRHRLAGGVEAAFTTRAEGNLALHVGDDPAAVEARRWSVEVTLGIPGISWCEQVHGAAVAVVTEPGRTYAAADALVTTLPRAPLAVLAADCVPVVLAGGDAVAVAHAGWRGIAGGVLRATVDAMREAGAREITAAIGPAIGPCCYEVGEDVAARVVEVAPTARAWTREGKPSVDLPGAAQHVLEVAGVSVERVGGCTYDDAARFFSYRRDGETGRHAAIVWRDAP